MRNFLSKLLFIIAIGALIVMLVIVGKKIWEYKQSRDTYNAIKDSAITLIEEEEADALNSRSDAEEKIEGPVLDINWMELGEKCVGWLLLDDISYPIMYSGDNDYYLHRLPDGTYNYGGSIFLGGEHKKDFSGDNSFVYGHNMNDGSMFGKLKKYDPKKDSSKELSKCFYIFTPDGKRHKYDFFTILAVESGSEAFYYDFPTKKQFLDYQEKMKKVSLYDSPIKPNKNGKIVTLSTCNGQQGTSHRTLIQGMETEVIQLK